MSRSMTQTGPTLGSPVWAGDFLNREHLVPGGAKIDAAQFLAPDGVKVVVGAAGAAQGATSVPVDALSGPIPNGTVLHFGTNKFAKLNAAAAAGATSLTVLALPTALVDDDTANYAGTQKKAIPSGTAIGRTITERDNGDAFGPAVSTDDEIFLTAYDVQDADLINDVELYRHGSIVKENFLPGWSTLATALKAELRALYTCTRGAE